MKATQPIPRIDKGTTIHQLREPVPVDLQGVFFTQVRLRRKQLESGEASGQMHTAEALMEKLKTMLEHRGSRGRERLMPYFVRLACTGSIEALRLVEGLIPELEGIARHLALMTELELRMQVYEALTAEPQALLASGLGGEGELIRLNGIAMQRDFAPWQDYQRELLHQELALICQEQGGYIEEELWGDEYYGFRLMLPYHLDIAHIIEYYLNQCNEYGQFLHPDCHVTNMILLTHEHIQEVVAMRKRQKYGLDIGIDIDAMLNKLLGNPEEADEADGRIQGDNSTGEGDDKTD